MRYSLLFSGNRKKAFVFSLDIVIAVLVTILVMTAAHRHIANSEENRLSPAQMIAVGSDIAAILDEKGILQTLDDDRIASGMNDLLPQNYDMLIKIITDDGTVIYAGEHVPEVQMVGTGKRLFTVKDGDSIGHYAYVKYWVWAR